MEREEGRRNWRTVFVRSENGCVENVKTNQTEAEAGLCLAEAQSINPGERYEVRDDWTPRSERVALEDKVRGWGCRGCQYRSNRARSCGRIFGEDCPGRTSVVSVIVMGASVGIWNEKGDVIKRVRIDEKLRQNVTAYLKEMNFLVDNTSSFDGWLDEFKTAEV